MTSSIEFSRRVLRKSSRFLEGDYEGINPQKFYRKLRRQLGEIQGERDFKYTVIGDRDRHLTIEKEVVGEKTGTVKGRLEARSDWGRIGDASIVFRPWSPLGVLVVLLGLVITVAGFHEWPLFVAGPLVCALGSILYMKEDVGSIPLESRDAIRVLIEGEVSEKKTETKMGERTEISGDMSVIYAGDVFLRIPPWAIKDAPWGLRTEIINRVKDWSRDRSQQLDTPVTGIRRSVSAWNWMNGGTTAERLSRLQGWANRDFEARLAYAEYLNWLMAGDSRRDTELDQVIEELESLKGGIDVFVEREGLRKTG